VTNPAITAKLKWFEAKKDPEFAQVVADDEAGGLPGGISQKTIPRPPSAPAESDREGQKRFLAEVNAEDRRWESSTLSEGGRRARQALAGSFRPDSQFGGRMGPGSPAKELLILIEAIVREKPQAFRVTPTPPFFTRTIPSSVA